jgi:uncharacterized membrane protein
MVDIYPWLKALHILLAIVAVGSNVTYGVWQARAGREPQQAGWTLRGIKFLDDRVANPAYIALAIVGVLLVLTGPWRFDMLWIAVSIGLYILLAVIGFAVYSPTLSRQIAVYEADGPSAPEFASLTTRSRRLGTLMAVVVVTIIVLMVVKPGA